MSDTPHHWVLFSVLVVLVLGSLAIGYVSNPGPREVSDPPVLVEPTHDGGSLWPYVSRTQSFETRTLGINLVVRGDPDRVRRYFLRHDDWRGRPRADAPAAAARPLVEPGIAWRLAHGGPRFTYVEHADQRGDGGWVEATYQLHEGTYLGTRYHVRAYPSPAEDGDWTAMQAHREYWDWFGLRHTVTSAVEARRHVVADLRDDGAVESVSRVDLDNPGTADGDGWASVIEFATLVLLVGLAGSASWASTLRGRLRSLRGERVARGGALVAAIGLVTLGVRVAGVTLEGTFPAVSPVLIAGSLYPVLAVGLPLVATYFARPLRMEPAFLLAVAAFAAALVVDLWYLGLTDFPVGLAFHRVTLVLSLGLVAAGASYRQRGGPRWNVLRQMGLAGWLFALVLPVVGLA